MTATHSIDLREKIPHIGSVRFLRAEWMNPTARAVMVWYEIHGAEQPLSLRLDLDKQVFLDDPSIDDVHVAREVKAHAYDVVKQVAIYRQARARRPGAPQRRVEG